MICSELDTALFGIEQLTLDFEWPRVPEDWQGSAIGGAIWRILLEPFTGVRMLLIGNALAWALSCALQSAEIGSDAKLLPSLEELVAELEEEHADNVFVSFIEARQVVGRPVQRSALQVSRERANNHLRRNTPGLRSSPPNGQAGYGGP